MPLYKRTPFLLAEPPKDLEPHEQVYQIRFTKEIFRDYEYPFVVFDLLIYLSLICGWILVFSLTSRFL